MEVKVRKERKDRRAIAAGRDIYAVTAPIVVEAIRSPALEISGWQVLQRRGKSSTQMISSEHSRQSIFPSNGQNNKKLRSKRHRGTARFA